MANGDSRAAAAAAADNNATSSAGSADKSTFVPILHCTSYIKPDCTYSVEDLEKMSKLKSMLGELTQEDEEFCTQSTLHRYLRARKFNLEKSADMLRNTLAWRKTYKPHEIQPEEIEPENTTGKAYINGFDRHGRPVLILTSARSNTKTYDRQLRNVVFLFESLVKVMPPNVEHIVVIVNFDGFSIGSSPPMHVSRSFMEVLSNHYPERLGFAICLNPPWIWWPIFNVIKTFLDPVTKEKIKFIESTDSKQLGELFDLNMLERRCGGLFNFDWNFEIYWKSLLEALSQQPTQ